MIFLIILCIIFLALVQILFSIPAPIKWLEAVWEAGDLISFVGTIALGIIAIKQTEDANDMNKRLMQLEENRYKLEMRPFIMTSDWRMIYITINELLEHQSDLYIDVCGEKSKEKLAFELTFVNTTQAFLSFTYAGASYLNSDEKMNWGITYTETTNKSIRLFPGESKTITFWGETEKLISSLKGKKIRFSFLLENRFGEKYKENIDCLVIVMRHPQRPLPDVIVEGFNYHIGKYLSYEKGNTVINWEDEKDGQS